MQLTKMRKNWFEFQIAPTIFLRNSNCEMCGGATSQSIKSQAHEKPLGVYYTKAT